MIKIRPQVMVAIVGLIIIALVTIWIRPEYIELVATGCITGVGMLAMKVIEDKD